MKRMLCLGMGYSARAIAVRLAATGSWQITGTARSAEGVADIARSGAAALRFDGSSMSEELVGAIRDATHLLISVPPGEAGDPAFRSVAPLLRETGAATWIGYLSTIGVYGDRQGGWVDESDVPQPTQERSIRRLAAENAWLGIGRETGRAIHVFRLAGIYGPDRNALESILAGEARRIVKLGQVFNRIHVEDIAATVLASIARPRPGGIYNLADDEPAPPEDVIVHAAGLLGLAPPPPIPFEDADLSPMARTFYGENKRVRNALIKAELGVRLLYPTYREGLDALLPSVQARFR